MSPATAHRPYADDPVVDRSLRHSVRDAAAYSVMTGGGETYFSAFAVFLKASTPQVALLASLPSLLGSFAQLFSAWWGHRKGVRKSLILNGVYLQAATWLPLMVLPLLFPEHAVALLIGCVVLYNAAGHLAVPQWSSMIGDLVPEQTRGRFFALRTRLASVMSFLALILAGATLNHFDRSGSTLTGYLVIFAVSAGARLISAYHLSQMYDPPRTGAIFTLPSAGDILHRARHSSFARFSFFFAAMQFSVAIASPFFTLYMLRDLHFTYLMFMTNTAATVLMQFMTLNMWGRISDRFGNRLVLATTGAIIPFFPSLWLVSGNFWYLLALQAVGGLVWAGFSLSAGNFVYDLVPSPKRATYVAYHNVLMGIGVFIGAMFGGWLGQVLPTHISLGGTTFSWGSTLLGVFLISTLVRVVIALLFIPHLREVREVPPMSASGLIFRVSGFNALAGLIFGMVLPRWRQRGANETLDSEKDKGV
jgi:MFS family permease